MCKLPGFIIKQSRSCVKNSLYLLLFIPLLASCSGGGGAAAPAAASTDTTGTTATTTTTPTTTDTIGSVGFPHTIVLTTPMTASVENLGGGIYRRLGTLIVTDKFGNPVVDGTEIDLGIIDSVIAEGTTGAFVAGATSLTDAAPKLSNGTLSDFSTATIPRNSVIRFIEEGDWLMITGLISNAADKVRNVTRVGINSTILPVQSPTFVGTNSGQTYVVGASLSGVYIEGLVANAATETWTRDKATTKDGRTNVRVTYPANSNTIHLGCGSLPPLDTRYSPLSSARVFTIATAGGGNATMVDEGGLCFASIAGWSLTTTTTAISGTTPISLGLVDGGDGISLPLVDISAVTKITTDTAPPLVLTVTTGATNINGIFNSTITVVSGAVKGDVATITYGAGDATVAVTLTIP